MADGAGWSKRLAPESASFSRRPGGGWFFPQWLDGRPGPQVSDFSQTPGDGAEGLPASMWSDRPAILPMRLTDGVSGKRRPSPPPASPPWRALVVEGRLKAGDTVLTLGTGGVSITALQLAKSMGAQVIVTLIR